MAKTQLPTFKPCLLKPQYWGIWIAVAIWRTLLLLPYPCLVKLGGLLGKVFAKVGIGKKRLHIAQQNLTLCFPEKNLAEINQLLKENQHSVGMAIIETGMAWFWSDRRIKKWCHLQGVENLSHQQGILLVGVHFLTLELGARIIGMYRPGIGVYRPNDNPVWDYLQCRGRMRSNKAMLDRKDVRGMLKALRQGEMIWYAPDHDYGRRQSVFVPFFAVKKASTTTGSHLLLRAVPNVAVVPFTPKRLANNRGYVLDISSPVDFSDVKSEEDTAIKMNHIVEREILKAPEQYMWMHRRFKTRPKETDPSLYVE